MFDLEGQVIYCAECWKLSCIENDETVADCEEFIYRRPEKKPKVESGGASLHFELRGGMLTVRHSDEEGEILLQGTALEGVWDAICAAAIGGTHDAHGAMIEKSS